MNICIFRGTCVSSNSVLACSLIVAQIKSTDQSLTRVNWPFHCGQNSSHCNSDLRDRSQQIIVSRTVGDVCCDSTWTLLDSQWYYGDTPTTTHLTQCLWFFEGSCWCLVAPGSSVLLSLVSKFWMLPLRASVAGEPATRLRSPPFIVVWQFLV